MNPFTELEKLLDSFERCSQLAGISQQKAVEHLAGAKDDTVVWLDKAEERRTAILAWVTKYVQSAEESTRTKVGLNPVDQGAAVTAATTLHLTDSNGEPVITFRMPKDRA